MVEQKQIDSKLLVSDISLISCIYLFLSSIGVAIYQVYFWARSGQWTTLSILDGLEFIDGPPNTGRLDWLYRPHHWFWLHKLLNHISLALFLMLNAVMLWLVFRMIKN
jgi:hypothetical protein